MSIPWITLERHKVIISGLNLNTVTYIIGSPGIVSLIVTLMTLLLGVFLIYSIMIV